MGRDIELKLRFAENLKRIMEEQGLSLSQLQTKSGVSRRMIAYLLSQERSPTLDVINSLAHGLKVPVDALLGSISCEDVKHLELIDKLTREERKQVSQYAEFILKDRETKSND